MKTPRNIKRYYEILKNTYEMKNYKFFDKGKYNLNLFGIRNENRKPYKFDDKIGIYFKDDLDRKHIYLFNATTDPSKYWLKKPMNNSGTAILIEGQHLSAFKLGYHKGEYEALVQNKNLTVYRDENKDKKLNFKSPETGQFGINMHRAMKNKIISFIGKFSAGCQVLQSPFDFIFLLSIVRKSVDLYGNSISYTLFLERDINYKIV